MKNHQRPPWVGRRDGPWPYVETIGELERAEQEWLHTNGAGAYAMSTIALMHTRRYHGAFVAALDPPLGRHVIVSHADTSITVEADKRTYRLATHQFPEVAPTPGYRQLQSFSQDPLPRWIFRLGKEIVERTMCLVRGLNAMVISYTWHGRGPARLSLRPLMPLRPVDKLMCEHGAMTQVVALRSGAVEIQPVPEIPPICFGHDGVFMGMPDWWRRFEYLEDRAQGMDFQEDMWTPGVFELALEPGKPTYLIAAVGRLPRAAPADLIAEARDFLLSQDPGEENASCTRLLSVAAEQFCLDDCPKPGIIAGYPWHAVFSRDQVLSIFGLHFARGRIDLAKRALATLLEHQRFGLIPETLVAADAPRAKPLPDATLWLFEAARELHERVGANDAFLKDKLYPALCRAFVRIGSEKARRWVWLSSEGLVANGAEGTALTWMDARVGSQPITPRRGLAVELQALWSKACETLAALAQAYGHRALERRATDAMERARAAFLQRFWCLDTDYPYDCVSEASEGDDAWVDASIRPNALMALAIDPRLFQAWQARAIVQRVRSELLTPRGIRSLSPNDPKYLGHFVGSFLERETAYHQGTAWTYLLGFYARAALHVMPNDADISEELREILEHATDDTIILGQVAQLADGDPPHRPRGCPAQATSVAELLRVLSIDLHR